MAGRVRVYVGVSVDGFLAGPNDELDWLGGPAPDAELPAGVLGFEAFMAEIGAMVMGRRTWEVVEQGGWWGYGETPILVATHRPLQTSRSSVRAASGTIDELLDEALAAAHGRDVYVDAGETIRAAMGAGRVDDVVLTVIPIAIGAGKPLFAGLTCRFPFELRSHLDYGGGALQLHLVPRRS